MKRWLPRVEALCNKCLQLTLDLRTTPTVVGAARTSSATEA